MHDIQSTGYNRTYLVVMLDTTIYQAVSSEYNTYYDTLLMYSLTYCRDVTEDFTKSKEF